jgi:hypothetical protein
MQHQRPDSSGGGLVAGSGRPRAAGGRPLAGLEVVEKLLKVVEKLLMSTIS